MSDDISRIYDAHQDLAIKRLAVGLRNIVFGQTVVLSILALGTLISYIAFIFRWEAGISFGLFLIGLWAIVSVILATLGTHRLSGALVFLPRLIRFYVSGYFLFPVPFFLPVALPFLREIISIPILGIVFLLYGLIPQFFIARWLARQAEEGTMEAVDNSNAVPSPSGRGLG